MSRLSVRLFLLLVCLGAIGGAAFHLWSSDRQARLDADAARRVNLFSRTVTASIGELRAAQQAYVAAGQGEAFWFDRVTAVRAGLDEGLSALRRSVTAPGAAAALDDAAAALADFTQMDLRARDYTRGGELTRASDMVFADGLELIKRASDAIAQAATTEQVAHDAAAAAVQKSQAMALASAGGITLLGLLLLVPVQQAKSRVAAVPVPSPAPPARATTLAGLDEFRPVARPVKPPVPRVNMGGVATLCNDLARISDPRALPGLLERTASVLDATGIILWIADPDGRELSPILVHGYPPNLATRLGTLARNAENLTASAYRTALLQTVKRDDISSGAIAVPLVAAGGCVGVMAAEVKNGGEQQEDLLAAATIVAAQLATLVGPPSSRAKAEVAS
jgi:hypothetical protein